MGRYGMATLEEWTLLSRFTYDLGEKNKELVNEVLESFFDNDMPKQNRKDINAFRLKLIDGYEKALRKSLYT